MRTFSLLLLVAFLILPSSLFAQSSNSVPDRKVTVYIENGSLEEALKTIFASAKVPYQIDHRAVKSIKEYKLVSVHADGLPLREVLDYGLYCFGPHSFMIEEKNGVVIISLWDSLPDKKVKIVFNNVDLDTALQILLKQVNINYLYRLGDWKDIKISYNAWNISFEEALIGLLNTVPDKPFHFGVIGWGDERVLTLFPKGNIPQDGDGVPLSNISLRFLKLEVKCGLKALFTAYNLNYTLDSYVMGSVALSLHNANLNSALNKIISQCKYPSIFRVENGVYLICPTTDDIPFF